jgi:hypothetical protein
MFLLNPWAQQTARHSSGPARQRSRRRGIVGFGQASQRSNALAAVTLRQFKGTDRRRSGRRGK